jgi:predicted transcriptional regulator
MFANIDPILLSQPRLSIMSLLIKNDQAEFNEIKNATGITSGNLSIQVSKLKMADYIEVIKQFKGNYPLTVCKITSKGVTAFNDFMKAVNSYDNNNISKIESEIWTPDSAFNLQ